MYYSHYSNIKFIDFELIYYFINLSIVSSFMTFNEFVSVFLSINCLFESIKLFSLKKRVMEIEV